MTDDKPPMPPPAPGLPSYEPLGELPALAPSPTPELSWWGAVSALEPHVVRISTPSGSGTGFLVARSQKNDLCGIATAAHVVHHAYFWEEPIRLDHTSSGGSIVVHHAERAILMDIATDTAVIILNRGALGLPEAPLSLIEKGYTLKIGNEIGWLGYPALAPTQACFFAGHISSWNRDQRTYLVDGVAINGVSGGPAFAIIGRKWLEIVGVVSAYVPNRATGEALPGLAIVRDVERFHETVERFATIDQAKGEEATPVAPPPPPEPPEGGSHTGRK